MQITAALVANFGRITGGYNVAMSGLMLGQFKEPESDIKLSIYEGSWFGKPTCFKLKNILFKRFYNVKFISSNVVLNIYFKLA